MQLTRDRSEGLYEIKSYEAGKITVNDEIYTRSLIITTTVLIDDWKPQRFSDLLLSDFDQVLSFKPEIIVLGTGEKMLFPAEDIMNSITGEKIGLEVMSTPAACRTFNVLMSEGRNAIAALLLQD